MRILTAALAAFLCLMSVTGPAMGQGQRCGSYEMVTTHLAQRRGEGVVWRGLTSGNLVELFAAAAGSWTLVVTHPDGLACLVAAGEAGEAVTAPPPKERLPPDSAT